MASGTRTLLPPSCQLSGNPSRTPTLQNFHFSPSSACSLTSVLVPKTPFRPSSRSCPTPTSTLPPAKLSKKSILPTPHLNSFSRLLVFNSPLCHLCILWLKFFF